MRHKQDTIGILRIETCANWEKQIKLLNLQCAMANAWSKDASLPPTYAGLPAHGHRSRLQLVRNQRNRKRTMDRENDDLLNAMPPNAPEYAGDLADLNGEDIPWERVPAIKS